MEARKALAQQQKELFKAQARMTELAHRDGSGYLFVFGQRQSLVERLYSIKYSRLTSSIQETAPVQASFLRT